ASISDLSENGQWAIGTSYTDGVDPATGMALGGYALTMWRVSNPSDPIAIDFPDAPGLEALSDLSNEGTFVGGTQDGRIFLVSSTSIEPLSLPAGTPAVGSVGSWYQSVPDMTAEGTTFVGSTRIADSDSRPRPYLGLNYLYQAVIWHDGQPTSLEVEPDTLSSEAVRVTDDGRLIG